MVRNGKKKILIFTIPNDGHLNILRRVIRDHQESQKFGLVLVDQKNTPANLSDVAAEVFIPARTARFVNTPAADVFTRVVDLLGECLTIARRFQPDLILYDFCALEGYFVGQRLGVPAWSSIPGMIGPLGDRGYLDACLSSPANQQAIGSMWDTHRLPIDPGTIEMVSNSLHIPAERNLLWSYPAVTPHDFRTNRIPAEYQFSGYLSDGHVRPTRSSSGRPLVYLSFGTEVMDNLWSAQEATRQGIRCCLARLARHWSTLDIDVVLTTQGKQVLDAYPANWLVRDQVDQQEVLSRADVFVTHGGSNSVHESLLARVPMVVTPFFGDQALTGRRVQELGLGIALTADDGVDKERPKTFLDETLADQVDGAVRRILHDHRFTDRMRALSLDATPPLAALG